MTTCWPSSTASLTTVACMGEVTDPPPDVSTEPACLRRAGAAAARRDEDAPAAGARSSGRLTSMRLPPTSTTTVCRAGASAPSSRAPDQGSMVLSNSVSIQRV